MCVQEKLSMNTAGIKDTEAENHPQIYVILSIVNLLLRQALPVVILSL